ncbi:phospholipase D [Labilithrix luteola]|uniref:phospholipase D n=1 Tax=Labilithrix luteola TaxID=1391654 RepID=A0A0K1Q2G8_9BACT|nr:phospholipase D [Labilithrix luteola]
MTRKSWAWVLASVLVVGAALGVAACNTAELKQPGGTSGVGASSGDPTTGDEGDVPGEGGSSGTVDAPPVPRSSNVTIQVQPSDSAAAIISAIQGAKKSVHMTMYLLTNTTVQDALIALHKAGKDVKVVLNKNFPPNGGDNTTSFNKLKAAGVDVVYAPGAYTFTHEKAVIIDGAKVLIMTMNLTGTSARDNREFIATDSDPQDVADAETIFNADYTSTTVSLNGKLVVSPSEAQPVDPRGRLTALIASAKKTLDVEIQSLSDSALTDAIIAAQDAGVKVRIVTTAPGDNEETPAELQMLTKMKAKSIPIVGLSKPYIHAKAIVVDGALAFVGSQNFTPTALFQNRELGVVTDATTEVAKVQTVIAQDFAAGTPR